MALATVVLGTASPAVAQGQQTGRRVNIGASVRALYDTNVSRTSSAFTRVRGIDGEDYRVTPALDLDISVPLGRQRASLSGMIGYDFYARNTRLNRERIGLNGALAYQFSRCDGTLTADYLRRQSELGDLAVIVGPNVVDRRIKNAEDRKTIGVTATCGPLIGLRPTASISQTWVENSSAIRKVSNFRSTSASAGVTYSRPVLGDVTLFGLYQQTRFPNRDLLLGQGRGRDGFESRGGGIRFQRQIGSRLTGLAELSYTSVRPDRDGVQAFNGLTWRLQATAALGSRLQLTASASRSVQATNRVDANYSIERDYLLGASYALGDRVTLNANASQISRRFEGAGTLFGPALLSDRIRRFEAGASYRANRRFSVSLRGTHETRSANNPLYEYDGNRIELGVSTTF